MRYECDLCKSWMMFTGIRCTNPNCPHHKENKSDLILPQALAQLTDDEVSLLFSFLLKDGNISSTATLLETTKYHTKERIKKLKNKLEVLARERGILTNYVDKSKM